MARNFDSEWAQRRSKDARTFVVCGETFVMKAAVRPESLAAFDDLEKESTIEDSMKAIDSLILSMIEPDDESEKRYEAIRAKEEDGLSIGDLREIVEWMIEQQTTRPTGSPSGSTGGRGRTGARSTAGSSLQGLPAA